MLLVGSALACHFESFMADADCDGWSANGSLYVCGTRDTLAYTVTLSQAGGVIATFTDVFVVWADNPTFNFNIPWGMELCGDYVAEGHFYYISPRDITDFRDFTVAFTCECGDDGCTGTPGYWKNHPEAWAGVSLSLGGVVYSQAQCLDFFDIVPSKKDGTKSAKLVHHLMAAKLNVMSGAAHSVDAEIAAADAWIAANCLFCNPSKDAWDEMEPIKEALDIFNNSNTTCDPIVEMPMAPIAPAFSSSTPQPDDPKSWGVIKMIYK